MHTNNGSGQPPDTTEHTRQLLIEATLACAAGDGLEKINIKRVAEQAGVTRQTVYRYFASSEALVTAASFAVGGELLQRMQTHINCYSTFQDKAVESVCFLTRSIPADAFLSQYFSAANDSVGKLQQVFEKAPLEFSYQALKSMYSTAAITKTQERWLRGLAEHSLRTVLALILAPGPSLRTEKAIRAYLDQWYRPLLG